MSPWLSAAYILGPSGFTALLALFARLTLCRPTYGNGKS